MKINFHLSSYWFRWLWYQICLKEEESDLRAIITVNEKLSLSKYKWQKEFALSKSSYLPIMYLDIHRFKNNLKTKKAWCDRLFDSNGPDWDEDTVLFYWAE